MARLADPALSSEATDALAALGERAVPVLRDALCTEETPALLRYAIPDVLQRVGTQEAEQALVENLLDVDAVLRLRIVAALNRLFQHYPDRQLERELVENALELELFGHIRSYQLLGKLSVETIVSQSAMHQLKESMSRELERIFRLMKLLLPQHDLHSAYVGLQSGNAVVHSNAVEFLENALPSSLKSRLVPLIDSEVSLADRIKLAERIIGVTSETSAAALAAFAASDQLLRDLASSAESTLTQI
jgi:HEAT repeat protein